MRILALSFIVNKDARRFGFYLSCRSGQYVINHLEAERHRLATRVFKGLSSEEGSEDRC